MSTSRHSERNAAGPSKSERLLLENGPSDVPSGRGGLVISASTLLASRQGSVVQVLDNVVQPSCPAFDTKWLSSRPSWLQVVRHDDADDLLGSSPTPSCAHPCAEPSLATAPGSQTDEVDLSSAVITSTWPLRNEEELKLMRYYLENIARRFDLCDPERHFATTVPWRAALCQPLQDAMFALSARCLSRMTTFDPYVSNMYYQRCLQKLIPSLAGPDALNDQDLFATVILLRALEEIDCKCCRHKKAREEDRRTGSAKARARATYHVKSSLTVY